MSETSMTVLAEGLCPWLLGPLAQLDAAHRSGRLGHAWLIKGPVGIGKLNLAYLFARRLLEGTAETPPPPLAPGDAVEAMRGRRAPADHHPDLHRVFPEPEKRTIGIEQIRDLSATLGMKAFRGAAKAAVIEPAEAMTPPAANALLKTLEEPAAQTYLFLVSHQPDRLLPTIRSRCQGLAVPAPPERVVAEWLGVAVDDPVMLIAGRAPLRAAELILHDKATYFSKLEEQLEGVSKNKVDPRDVAEQWVRQDADLALEWLIGRIERTVKARAAQGVDSKAVTPVRGDPLHNAWLTLPLRTLFERLEAAQRLLDRLGSGINVELALHGLLLGFRTERG